MLQIKFVNRRISASTKYANTLKIDRVVLRETINSELFYTKAETNNLLDNKVSIPTQAELDNFTLTLQGQ